MVFPLIRHQFAAADSSIDLARRLGAICLGQENTLAQLMRDPEARRAARRLEQCVAASDIAIWEPGDDGTLSQVLEDPGLSLLVDLVHAHHPLEYLSVLKGLCHRVLPTYFLGMEGRLLLDCGMPIPHATRPIDTIYSEATPYDTTLEHG